VSRPPAGRPRRRSILVLAGPLRAPSRIRLLRVRAHWPLHFSALARPPPSWRHTGTWRTLGTKRGCHLSTRSTDTAVPLVQGLPLRSHLACSTFGVDGILAPLVHPPHVRCHYGDKEIHMCAVHVCFHPGTSLQDSMACYPSAASALSSCTHQPMSDSTRMQADAVTGASTMSSRARRFNLRTGSGYASGTSSLASHAFLASSPRARIWQASSSPASHALVSRLS